MHTIARLLPFSLLLLTAAADAPALAPTADVTATYTVVRAQASGGPRKIVVRQTAGGTRTRIDSYIFADGKAPYETLLLDSKSNRSKVLVYARQAVFDIPSEGVGLQEYALTPDLRFKRGPDKTVAGQKCTEWTATPPKGDPWTTCVTAKGVVLRTASATRELEATAVKTAPLPADTFAIPPDLKPMTLVPAPAAK